MMEVPDHDMRIGLRHVLQVAFSHLYLVVAIQAWAAFSQATGVLCSRFSKRRSRAFSVSLKPLGRSAQGVSAFSRYSAHWFINTRRRSTRSLRAYAASVAFWTAWARAASITACGASVCSDAQSRKLDRNP